MKTEESLLTMDKAAIEKSTSIPDMKRVVTQAELIRQALKSVGENFEKQQKAAEIKLRAQYRIGQLLIEGRNNGTIAKAHRPKR